MNGQTDISVKIEKLFSAKIKAQITIFLFIASLFFVGICIGGLALQEPDTCFILAMGRWIAEHRCLPVTDPFSWTYAIMPNGGPFVIYQWLTEVIFYKITSIAGAMGLLILAAVVLTSAFVIVPMRIMNYCQLGLSYALPLGSLMALSECAHINMRPEIFSYLLLSMFFQILIQTDRSNKIDIGALFWLAILMLFWCNLHSAFVLGLMLLLLWSILSRVDAALFHLGTANKTADIALPLCLATTLVNPAGIKLWQYLPHLFFTPLNATINELQAINFTSLASPIYYPFFLLSILFFAVLYRKLKAKGIQHIGLKSPILGLLGIVQGVSAKRMLTFAVISLLPSIATLLKKSSVPLSSYEQFLQNKIKPNSIKLVFLCLVVTLAGVLMTSISIPPEVPESCAAFHSPDRAIACLEKHPQSGRLLNDPHFGDVMMWQMKTCPPLFIDSRYDIYDFKLLGKYWDMVLCRNDWQNQMRALDINWLILQPQTVLTQTLRKDHEKWETLYEDEYAIIMRQRPKKDEGIMQ